MSNLEILPKVCLQRRVAESYNKGFADGLKFAKEMREPLEVKSEDIPEEVLEKLIEGSRKHYAELPIPLGNPYVCRKADLYGVPCEGQLPGVLQRMEKECDASWEEYYADE